MNKIESIFFYKYNLVLRIVCNAQILQFDVINLQMF